MMKGSRTAAVLLAVAAVVLALAFYYPLLSFLTGFSSRGGNGERGGNPLALLLDPYYRRIILFTAWQAALSAALSLALGLPGAYFLSHYDFPGKRIVSALTTVPFLFPPILVVLGFTLFFGSNGWLNARLMSFFSLSSPPLSVLYSITGIVLAHAFYNFPVVVRTVSTAWERIPRTEAEAAKTLGAGPFAVFRTVTLPALAVPILSSVLLVFLFCSLSFSVVLVLGGGPKATTTEVELYRSARIELDMGTARALASVEAVLNFVALALYYLVQRKSASVRQGAVNASRPKARLPGTWKGRTALSLYALVCLLAVVGPIASVAAFSFLSRSGSFGGLHASFIWYERIFSIGGFNSFSREALPALLTTSLIGVAAATLAVGLGGFFAASRSERGRGPLALFLYLPLGTSTIALSLALEAAYPRLAGSVAAVVLLHAVIAFPFAYASLRGIFGRIPPALYEAARMLGAGPWTAHRTVGIPLARRGAVAAWAFCFALSAGELNVVLALGIPGLKTVPLVIYRMVASYNYFAASALGMILAALSCVLFLFSDIKLKGDSDVL
jgi:thiamine transport system permease protein